jgi:putative ABC transport system permease protein
MSGLGLGAQISLVLLLLSICVMFVIGMKRPFVLRMAFRFLKSHFKMNMALLSAACVSTTVITGSLIAGDSLKESITEAVYENLGEVDEIVTSGTLFNTSIVQGLKEEAGLMDLVDHISPIIHISGIAVNPDTNARTQKASIIGIDGGFFEFGDLHDDHSAKLTYDLNDTEIYINEELANDLDLDKGDMLKIFISNQDAIFEAIFHSGVNQGTFEADFQVKKIVRSESLGRFQLTANRNPPQNVYVPLETLNTVMGVEDSANMILVSNTGDEREGGRYCNEVAKVLEDTLDSILTLEDTGLKLVENQEHDYIKLESDDVFLSYDYFEHIENADIPALDASSPILTYFWNTLTLGNRKVAYSTVTAFGPQQDSPFGMFFRNGSLEEIEGSLEDNEIMINNWTAWALSAQVGDTVIMNYSVMDEFYNINYLSKNFTIRHIIDLEGKANDTMFMPSFPGIEGKTSPLDWDPPFPIDFSLIEDEDEDYWEIYGGTPKAFISLKTGAELWNTDLGNITQIRMRPKAGFNLSDLSQQLRDGLNDNVGTNEAKLSIRTVKEDALKSEEGIEIFTQMFLAFSAACIIASAVLIVLLIMLRIDYRGREIGILRSIGFRLGTINHIYLIEGTFISILGGILGVIMGLLFGAFLIGGMNSFWSQIVESASVTFSYSIDSLVIGLCAGILISIITMIIALRYEGRNTVAGSIRKLAHRGKGKKNAAYSIVLLLLGLSLLILPLIAGISIESEAGVLVIGFALPLILLAISGIISSVKGKRFDHIVGIGILLYTFILMILFSETVSLTLLFFLSGFLLLFGFLLIFYHQIRRIGSEYVRDPGKNPKLKERRWLMDLARKNAARTPKRTMFSVFLFALTLFVLVSLTINLQGAVFDVDRALAENGGGYHIMGESVNPIYANLNDEASLRGINVQNRVFSELAVEQFKTKGDVGGTCSNLNPHASPRIIGANESFFESNSFVFTSHKSLGGLDDPWYLLTQDMESNEVPCIGDYNTIVWILGLDVGSTVSILDENGEIFFMKIVGIIGNSIFPGSLIIWDEHFDLLYPTDSGFDLFLFKSDSGNLKSQIVEMEGALSSYGFDGFTVESAVLENIQVENTYISIFQVILVFGLVIGTVGFGIVASRNAFERRREIGILRAMGFTRKTVIKALVLENAYIISVGIIIGFLSGIIASSVYLLKLDIDIGSWPWLYVLALGLLSFAIALISTVIPVLRSTKMMVSEALRGND